MLLFGAGGQLVEVFQDHALSLPPLNTTLARRFMEQTQIFKALQGVRGRKPVNIAALEDLMVQVQPAGHRAALDQRDRYQSAAGVAGAVAGARRESGRVRQRYEDRAELPRLAIRPYPAATKRRSRSTTGAGSTSAPIRPEDEPLLVNFHHTLSERSVYMRYFHWMKAGAAHRA